MNFVFISFLILAGIFSLYAAFLILKNSPNNKERLKVIIPVVVALSIGAVCYSFGWHAPTGEIGKFQ